MSQYILWNPSSDLPPKKVYSSRPEAIKAALSLANQGYADEVLVCKVVGRAEHPSVKAKYEDLSEG